MKSRKTSLALIFSALLTFSFTTSNAQIFEVGAKDLNFQLGFGSNWYYSYSSYTSSMPLISVGFDYGLKDDLGPGVLGIGGLVGYKSFKYDYNWGFGTGEWKYSVITIAPRGTYHYQFTDKLDTYGGLLLGFDFESFKWTGDDITGIGNESDTDLTVYVSLFVGGKYYVTEKLAVMSEIYIVRPASFNLGVSLRL